MADQTHITRSQLEAADRTVNAYRVPAGDQDEPPDQDQQQAAADAAHITALENELALLEHLGNPRANQVRIEIARATKATRRLSAA